MNGGFFSRLFVSSRSLMFYVKSHARHRPRPIPTWNRMRALIAAIRTAL